MADTEEASPAALLDRLASLDPQERRKVATIVRSLSVTLAEVPQFRSYFCRFVYPDLNRPWEFESRHSPRFVKRPRQVACR
jgi:hypothetical protein